MFPVIIAVSVVVVVIIGALVAFYFSPKQRIKREKNKIAAAFEACDGEVFTDYAVEKGSVDKIDIIYVGRSGMYVAKTVHHNGTIYGDNMQKEWLAVSGGKETRFKSPIREKDALVNDLRTIIPTDYSIYSCVVFTEADIKEVRCSNVMTLKGLADYIKGRPDVLTDAQIKELKSLLVENKKHKKN